MESSVELPAASLDVGTIAKAPLARTLPHRTARIPPGRPRQDSAMLYLILVFGHLLATSMALGAIVATDLRMLSKLAHDRVRIPPPNEFVARLVTIALVLLYVTG